MKTFNTYFFIIAITTSFTLNAQVAVNIDSSDPDGSAMLDIKSTDKGFLPPRMTEAQRANISEPAAGLLVYQIDETPGYYYYTGTDWIAITSTGPGAIITSSCVDIDGNAYSTFTIARQVWMAENLRVTHYSNGDPIPNIPDYNEWEALTTGAYCWYDNDSESNEKYGKLYNWYAVDDTRGLCPEGWQVPTEAEWETLATYLGGRGVAGGKMKAISNLWTSPTSNPSATNISNFSGLPGGFRLDNGPSTSIHSYGYWWSSTPAPSPEYGNAIGYSLYFDGDLLAIEDWDKRSGLSVRCLQKKPVTNLSPRDPMNPSQNQGQLISP